MNCFARPARWILCASLLSASCHLQHPADEWRHYGADLASSKYSELDQIQAGNFQDLQIAWRWRSPEEDIRQRDPSKWTWAFEPTPLMIDGVLYTSTSLSQVAAIDAVTGQTLWVHQTESHKNGSPPNNGFLHRGVSYWESGDDKRVYIATGHAFLIALEARSGQPVEGFGQSGRIDLTQGLRRGFTTFGYGVTSPPCICRDVVVVGASILDFPFVAAMPPGDVRGFDVRTGELLWTFRSVPQPGEAGNQTWENESWRNAGSTNVWTAMSCDPDLGMVYLPFSTASNDYYGGERHGDNLFAESLVALNVETGQRVWHFQTAHHGIWDYDLGSPPNLLDITVEGKGIKAVAQPTKQGFLFVFDRLTGQPVWPIEERAVPPSNTPGERVSPTQPFPTKPAPFDQQGVSIDNLINFTPQLRQEAISLINLFDHGPLFTPPTRRGTLVLPGNGGAASWNGAAVDPHRGVIYIPSVTQHNLQTLSTIFTNRGPITAGVVTFPGGPRGLPFFKPPYGRVTAIDLNSGEHLWMTPIGRGPTRHASLIGLNLPDLGWPWRPFTLLTKTLLIVGQEGPRRRRAGTPRGNADEIETFIGGRRLRALDPQDGSILGSIALPGDTTGSPMTYMADGRQFIVVPIGGASFPAELVALALPEGALPQAQPAPAANSAPVQLSAQPDPLPILQDANGNRQPDPGEDLAFQIERHANRLILRPQEGSPGGWQIVCASPHPVTGRWTSCSMSSLLSASDAQADRVRWTALSYDASLRPTSFRIEEESPGPEGVTRVTSLDLECTDTQEDGLLETCRQQGAALTVFIDLFDLDQDGGQDYASLPFLFPSLFIPLTDSDQDGAPDSLAFLEGSPFFPIFPQLAGSVAPAQHSLYFAHFGDGANQESNLFSQITLFNLDPAQPAQAEIRIRDGEGNPLATDLNGSPVEEAHSLAIPAGGLRRLVSDGQGELEVGSVEVLSDRPLGGVILFGGSIGLAGVGNSLPTDIGFLAPVERRLAAEINTGIAVMNLEGSAISLGLSLKDLGGSTLASFQMTLPPLGRFSQFIHEFDWQPQPPFEALDLNDFQGLIELRSSGRIAATALQSRPGEFATLPVARLLEVGDPSAFTQPELDQSLFLAHLGNGTGNGFGIKSQVVLINLAPGRTAQVRAHLTNGGGLPLPGIFEEESAAGQIELNIPPGGMSVLSSDGQGDLQTGSLRLESDQPLAGVILFSGNTGLAGVGASPLLPKGFLAPVEASSADSLKTGIALMNLERLSVLLDLSLRDSEGKLLASASIQLPPRGRRAFFIDEIEWQAAAGSAIPDLSDFSGILRAESSGKVAATALQTRNGILATLPVVPGLE